MAENIQKDAFLAYEANSWFERNEQQLLEITPEKDPILKLLSDYQIQPEKCLEIGASMGFRLNGIQQLFSDCQVTGIEPSKKAIVKGKIQYPTIQLLQGTADDLSVFPDNSFDLVIGGFFMYVVDRSLLLKVVAEMDRVLTENGKLILIDFFAVKPSANEYHHIKSAPSFSYKQNYEDIFLASGLYHLLHKETIHHASYLNGNQKDSSNNFRDKACITALIKDSKAIYA